MAGYTLLDDIPTPKGGGYTLLDDAPVSQPKLSLKGEGYDKAMNYSGRDAIGGQIRGAGSLGASLISPFESSAENASRRTAMDDGLTSLIGSNPESMGYQSNKLAAEIAGSAGIGGGIAGLVSKIPGALKYIPALIDSVKTGGMSAAGEKGLFGAASRVAGGTVTGAATAGAVDPQNAEAGAFIGAALPPAVQLAGKAGVQIGKSYAQNLAERVKEFSRNAPKNDTVRQSLEAGYTIPPNMVQPSLANQIIESISGKQATQQIASAKNEKVTADLVRKSLGLADDAPLTESALVASRKVAGKPYQEVGSLSKIAGDDLEALKAARFEATSQFKFYNRSGDPAALAKGKEARSLADILENSLESEASAAGRSELIPALREARKQIAKTYTVGRAINDASGTVDSRVLGRMYEKGMPLSDGLDTAGRFGSAFPTISKSQQQVGSPAAHNLKSMAAALMGGGGYAALGPVGVAAAAAPFIAPSLARAAMFRKGVQESLVNQAPTLSKNAQLAKLLSDPELNQILLRAAPVTGSQAQQ